MSRNALFKGVFSKTLTERICSKERGIELKLLLDDGDGHIGRHGAPNLRLYRVLARAEEFLDVQMLLDPLEKQFDLPTTFVKCGDGERRRVRGFAPTPIMSWNQRLNLIVNRP